MRVKTELPVDDVVSGVLFARVRLGDADVAVSENVPEAVCERYCSIPGYEKADLSADDTALVERALAEVRARVEARTKASQAATASAADLAARLVGIESRLAALEARVAELARPEPEPEPEKRKGK